MKKSKKYMSDDSFNRLVESLNQAIEYERGERDDCRVTVVAAPGGKKAKTISSKKNLKTLTSKMKDLSDASLSKIDDFVEFLRFQERSQTASDEGAVTRHPSR